VINLAVGNRPLILQKSGGLQGSISGDCADPGVAAFFAMKEFGSGGFTAAVAATNGLIGQLAPR
jgi:serine-type D-Ala-D-Ala carboxypeptidase/endopeptidase